ncbi:0fda707b-d341-4578-9530-ec2ff6ce7634 [Sclerotinia trifoliorum]|uniref:0fda707b-d341-4578-9530-ec2ff6ce7634 n=1 Tax=Sclerotinia trifoliorum TaxID=28548 RepID=A0A8H2VML8_9HELO|nr:0fda707b-d341-4578-9530-ec2ff6ce7634 [Sclerotinia trifoliorum]
MYFTQTLFFSALSISSVFAATNTSTSTPQTHVVRVGSTNNSIKYFPEKISAQVGDVIQFQFAGGNHTVTQSTFDAPCVPISQSTNNTGVFSGFMNVAASLNSTGMVPVFSMPVKVATPMWFYCSQAKHCQKGMVLVVNENTKANASRSLSNFASLAAKAPANLFPTLNGTSATASTSGTPGTSSTSESNSGSSSGSSSDSDSSSSSSNSDSSSTTDSTTTTLSPSASSTSSETSSNNNNNDNGDSSSASSSSSSSSSTKTPALATATANTASGVFGVHNIFPYTYVGILLGVGMWGLF